MLHTLLKSVREYRLQTIVSPLLVVSESAIETFIPFLMAAIIDQGIRPGNLSVVIKVGVLLLLMSVVSLTFGAGASWVSSQAAAGFAKNLRHDIFSQIQTFSFQNLDHFATSSLVTRLTTDITNIQTAYQMLIRVAVRAPSMLLFSIIMAFLVSRQAGWLFVCVVPVLAIGLFWIVKKSRPLFRQVFRQYDKLNRVVRENLRGIRVVKTYGQQGAEISKFRQSAKEIAEVFAKAQRIVALNMPLMQFVISTTMLILSWLGAKLIVGKALEIGQFVSLFTYSISILYSLNMLAMIFSQLSVSQASAERAVEVLETAPDIVAVPDAETEVPDGSIDFEHVTFSYPGTDDDQLNDVNLHINSGAVVGIIGETGTSKTTLVSLIPRLYDVSSGVVRVGGKNVRQYALKTLRDQVAMVLQNTILFSGTVRENLKWGNPDATDEQLDQVLQQAQAKDFVAHLPAGLDTQIEQTGQNVSGGQRQRLTIARALLKQPKILILDNATSATDTQTEARIRQAFKQDLPNVTKLMITQRIGSIIDADQIIIMKRGGIEAIGTHDELMVSNQWYRQLYQAQQKTGGNGHE
ncbi:multidrug ABC transporter ATP-binding and permease protein [Secundilactobacillus silagincola]|uniref:Multidrug ABC transporter ATP-binding and permease protein n=1 Tax=Secundilactobacillus silagincola TaxID=1714681 RepID=A0A1Z5H4N7_9LACO|nr:ABC transporter ATP-binding protein [Secundilactobacillus silagincola]GAT18276.1 multidrug ABC transporter ATP-binding and permease protein [Secundilactobacillus silagincola]